jgi:hypothetical protein
MTSITQYHLYLAHTLVTDYGWTYWPTLNLVRSQLQPEEKCCSICMVDFENTFAYITPCGHKYHIECILPCILDFKRSKCPDCECHFEIFHKDNNLQPSRNYSEKGNCEACKLELHEKAVTVMTECKHKFHTKCLGNVYNTKNTCNCPVIYCNKLILKKPIKNTVYEALISDKPILPKSNQNNQSSPNKTLRIVINKVDDKIDDKTNNILLIPKNYEEAFEIVVNNKLCLIYYFDPSHNVVNNQVDLIIKNLMLNYSNKVTFAKVNIQDMKQTEIFDVIKQL